MSPRATSLIPLVAVALLAGCSSTLKVSKYDPGQNMEGEGSVYFLPRVLLELRFGVEVTARPGDTCARALDDCAPVVEFNDIRLVEPEMVSLIVPDDRAGFVLESQGTFVTETDFTASFNQVGELLAANSSVSDKTFETAAWGIETLGKLFTGTVMAGSSELKATQQRAERREQLLKAIRLVNEDARHELDGGDAQAVLDAGPQLADLYAELAEVEDALTTVTTLPVACAIDPGDISLAAGEDGGVRVFDIDPARPATCPGYAWLQDWMRASGLASAPPLPGIKIRMVPQSSVERLRSADDQWQALRRAAGSAGDDTIPGLVYRVPAWFEISVLSTSGPLIHDTLAIPQLGQLAALTIDQNALRKDRTLEITLFEGLGSVETIHYSLSPMDVESANQVVDAVLNVKANRAQVETDQLEAQTAQIQAEMDFLQAQAELEALKAELEAAKAGETDAATPVP